MNFMIQMLRCKQQTTFPLAVKLAFAASVVLTVAAFFAEWGTIFKAKFFYLPQLKNFREIHLMNNDVKIYKYEAGKNNIYDKPNGERIYFHENDWQGRLNERQTCAVESAAFHNPERPVQVFLQATDNFDYSSRWWKVLSNYKNVDIIIIDEKEYAKGTPLQDWWEEERWRASPHWPVHLTDFFRMTSLYKGGGMYLDLDYITIKPFGDLRNFFVMEQPEAHSICSSVFHLDRDHRFANEILSNISKYYDPEYWGIAGGPKITEMMHTHCGFKRLQQPYTNNCKDIKLLPYWTFLPIVHNHFHLIFKKVTNYSLSFLRKSYGFHYWNSKSKYEFIDMSSNMFFAVIAREHCPLTAQEAIRIDYNDDSLHQN